MRFITGDGHCIYCKNQYYGVNCESICSCNEDEICRYGVHGTGYCIPKQQGSGKVLISASFTTETSFSTSKVQEIQTGFLSTPNIRNFNNMFTRTHS